ncbi:hypothetical protein CF336_g3332, partial [Tilletia laevis]
APFHQAAEEPGAGDIEGQDAFSDDDLEPSAAAEEELEEGEDAVDHPNQFAADSDSDSDFTIVGIKRGSCFKKGTTSGTAFPIFKKAKR